MEQIVEKNLKLGKILAIAMAALMLAYLVLTTLPIMTYTRLEPAEVKGMEENVSLMQYLWVPYNYADLTGDVLPDAFKAELSTKYAITNTIYIPLFVFIVGLFSMPIIYFGRKRAFSVLAPFVWSLLGLIGYFTSNLLNLSMINTTTRLIHIILFALVLIISIVSFVLVSIPRMKYVAATKERI